MSSFSAEIPSIGNKGSRTLRKCNRQSKSQKAAVKTKALSGKKCQVKINKKE